MATYFAVSFADKNKAKALGAWWDQDKACWFAPHDKSAQALAAAGFVEVDPSPITVLPGEDRAFGGNGLFVDLVPHSCWFTNVRYCINPADWTRLSKGVRQRASQKCEVCASSVHLEAHERWDYDEDQSVQTLKRIISLCSLCHLTTHFGFAQLKGMEDQVREHLKRTNGWEDGEANIHISNAFDLWQERSQRTWHLDLSIIEDAGIGIVRPVKKEDRGALSEEWPA